MCAINGIIAFDKISRQELEHKISVMQEITNHRGPDQNETLVLERTALGMSRLAIVAPTENIIIQTNGTGKKNAVFNGEIVNHLALRKLIKRLPNNQHSDSAVILPLLEELGQDFIHELAGMFTIAVNDQEKHQLQLWRDPLGIKPLYYYQSNNCFIFSSEIKAIYAVAPTTPVVNFAALDDILKYRFHPGRDTVFPDIKRVLPGETIILREQKIQRKQYWTLKPNNITTELHSSVEEFRSLFLSVVQEHSQADVEGGFFVSGGLDSSLVTAMALQSKSVYSQPISIKFTPNPVIDEEYGKLLERHLKKPFEWVNISDSKARQTLIELVKYIDEPLENPIHIGTFLMAERARELGIKSVITGDGSDEFFLGYERYLCWFNNLSGDPSTIYPRALWTLKPGDAEELYTPEAKSVIRPMRDARNLAIEPFLNIDQVLMFERLDRLPEYHNMRLDRMTMAHGVEAKVPFLDRRIVDFALQIPLPDLFGASGKGWLQEVAKPWLPLQILNRPKVHFPSLPDQWLSGSGANWAAEILLDPAANSKKWINPSVLERYIKEHRDGINTHGRVLWALVVLELWLRNLSKWRKV